MLLILTTLTTLAMLGMLATNEATVAMPPLSNYSQVFQVFANLSRSFGLFRVSWLFKLFQVHKLPLLKLFGVGFVED